MSTPATGPEAAAAGRHIVILNWKDPLHPAAGGAETYTHECAKRWVADGHRVTLVCAGVDGRPAEETIDGVRVVRGGSRFGVYRFARRWLARQDPSTVDLVIDEVNTRPFLTPRWMPRILPGVPFIALAHQSCEEVWYSEMPWPVAVAGHRVFEPSWWRSYRDVPTLVVSNSTADSIRAFGVRHTILVPEGVTLPDELPEVPKEDRPTVVFCGRLVGMKRPDDAITAFLTAQRTTPALADAQMWVVGGGPMLEELRSRYAGTTVHILGRVSDTERWERMAAAHLLVATSVREGWGLVVSEAAAVGTPAVGYDVPGLRDSVAAGDGTIVAPTVDALADALATLLPAAVNKTPVKLPHGGASSWDDVADAVLDAATTHARPTPARPLLRRLFRTTTPARPGSLPSRRGAAPSTP